MVQVPSTNTVRESRHVAIYGLPNTIADESLHHFFARFGEIQRLFRQQENQDVIFISFKEQHAAHLAHAADPQFDRDTRYRITYYYPDSARSPIHFPPESTVLVEFDTNPGLSYSDRFIFEEVKRYSKRTGIPKEILFDPTSDPAWRRARVFYYRVDLEKLRADRHPLFGKTPTKLRITFIDGRVLEDNNSTTTTTTTTTSGRHPPCAPSTSYAHHHHHQLPKLKGNILEASCSVHVPNQTRLPVEYYMKRFESYGHILDVEMVKTNSDKAYAVVQFTNFEDAHKALNDKNEPKPQLYHSMASQRLILSYLPQDYSKDEIMLKIRMLSDKISEICLDWKERSAVITMETFDDASVLLKRMRTPNRDNFGPHRVAVDYCSLSLNTFFVTHRRENLNKAAAAKAAAEASTSSPSTSRNDVRSRGRDERRNQMKSREPLRQSSSIEQQPHEDEEPGSSSSSASSGSSGSSGSSSSNNSDDEGDEEEEDVVGRRQPKKEELDDPSDQMNGDGEESTTSRRPSRRTSHPSTSSASMSPPPKEIVGSSASWEGPSTQGTPFSEDSNLHEPKEEVFSPTTSSPRTPTPSPPPPPKMVLPENNTSRMFAKMTWKDPRDLQQIGPRIEQLVEHNNQAKAKYEKLTGRSFPKFISEDELKTRRGTTASESSRDAYFECSTSTSSLEFEQRLKELKRLADVVDLEDFRAPDPTALLKAVDSSKTSATPTSAQRNARKSYEERGIRLSLDSTHHPLELAQRSQSMSIGPMTPITPFQPTTSSASVQPLLINTSSTPSHQMTSSQPSTSGVSTPRSAQPPQLVSPLSRHGSMSSTSGRPASIREAMRHHSVMFPPDVSIPPPPIPPTHDELLMAATTTSATSTPPSRRSSETMVAPPPLRSPPFSMPAAGPGTGPHSVASSAHSTPRHSISGTPGHEPLRQSMSTSSASNRPGPEKIQLRHDSMSKPGPSSAASALQARSQSISVATENPRKQAPPPPAPVRDAGSDLIDQIMSNQPSMGFKKLPRIEKKPSALQNVHNLPNLKDKEKEKEKRRLEKEREARKEMKRKETKEERHKRKEMERMRRDEEERRERKQEKLRMKEKEDRRREKEKERRRAEKTKQKKAKKKKHRKGESSDDSEETTSNEDIDLDFQKNAEMSQVERDHKLALLLSKGGIIENLKSRRRSDKRGGGEFEKIRQKNQNAPVQRRVLIESSDDDDDGDGDDDEKETSSIEGSDNEEHPRAPPSGSTAPTTSSSASEAHHLKKKTSSHKEREKGELSTSSENEEEIIVRRLKLAAKEDRKRMKSLANYSSDDHSTTNTVKRMRREEQSDEESKKHDQPPSSSSSSLLDPAAAAKQRKRKMAQRRQSSEDERRNTAKRDFRDIPHEDVSDEEEVVVVEDREDQERIRRQSTSSTTSQTSKKQKIKTTPLRIDPSATTPLTSPKLTSKRPSISATENPEPLMSPKLLQRRQRTTSSTSTATSSSKHEAEAAAAKNSVSSIEEIPMNRHDEFPSVESPMSTSGRPMVLTKAAMKAFNSEPQKKPSNDSSSCRPPHESSSADGSSSSGSTTSESSSESSEDGDSSEDEGIPPPPIPPILPPPPVVEHQKKPEEELLKNDVVVEEVEEEVREDQEGDQKPEKENSEEKEEKPEKSEASEVPKPEPTPSEDVQEPGVPEEHATPSETPPEAVEKATTSKIPRSLISDQETDQAVQSIFDDEEEPIYTDIIMSSSSAAAAAAAAEQQPTDPSRAENNGHGSSTSRRPTIDKNDDDDVVILESAEIPVAEEVVEETIVEEPQQQQNGRSATPTLDHQDQAEAPIQPLQVSIATSSHPQPPQPSHQQVVQPSPRPAQAPPPASEPSPRIHEHPSINPNLTLGDAMSWEIHEFLTQLQINPYLRQSLTADQQRVIQTFLCRHPPGNLRGTVSDLLKPKSAQEAHQHRANSIAQQKKLEAEAQRDREAKAAQAEAARRLQEERQEAERRQREEEQRQKAERQFRRQQEEEAIQKNNGVFKFLSNDALQHISMLGLDASIFGNLGTNGVAAPQPQQQRAPQHPSPAPSTSSPAIAPPRAPLQPSTAANRGDHGDIDDVKFQRWFYENFPMVWTGRLALKSTEAMINLHLINGSETFLNGVLGRQLSADNPRRDSMKIMQRLRLDNGQVEHVHRILTNPDYACCLALSSVTDIDSLARSDANLKASFIDYLTNKQIAGISSLEEIESRFRSARVHVFAPGDIVNKYLSELAPPLHDYLQTTDTHYLLIVFTNDKLEPNMSSPPTTTSLAVPQPSN